MSASLRHWPIWAVALVGLLVGVWLTDDDTVPAALSATHIARQVPSAEGRAMVGTWYVADDSAATTDAHCAHDVRLGFHLRSNQRLGYTLDCITADGAPFTRRGMVLLDRDRAADAAQPWRASLVTLALPHTQPLLLLHAVDHSLGLASVHLHGAHASLLISRSQRAGEDAVQAFLHHASDLQNVADNATSHTERLVQRTKL